ncbi:SDR family oxidoreductase [Actinosynnema sp. NPDC053489]|uniref:SDR family oxidoreductase n=1 Tax=Actinosynnema sp. NPDC053489 TaxID=3363916 RepID=UPI0037CAE40B
MSGPGAGAGTSDEFAGKVVLVTGGGKGVGRAIVREFTARGAHVVINYFHSARSARATQQEVEAAGGSCELIRGSVAKPDDVTAMFDAVRQRAGRLDVLVNNAARGVLAPANTLTDVTWQKVFDVNVHGARRCAWAALPLLAETGGSVVNVSSIGAGMVIANYTVVGVSKAALEALSRYLAVEFAPYGVRVNVASSGFLDSPTATRFPGSDTLRANNVVSTPLGRLGTEQELAGLVAVLASPRTGWVTGQVVLADGGISLGNALFRPDPPRPATARPPRPPGPGEKIPAADRTPSRGPRTPARRPDARGTTSTSSTTPPGAMTTPPGPSANGTVAEGAPPVDPAGPRPQDVTGTP